MVTAALGGPSEAGKPRVQMVIYRDPDFANQTWVFVDGQPADDLIETYNVDPGAGWTRSDWDQARDEAIADASSDAVRQVLQQVYDAGARHTEDTPW